MMVSSMINRLFITSRFKLVCRFCVTNKKLLRPRSSLQSSKCPRQRMFNQKLLMLRRQTRGSSQLHPSKSFNHRTKPLLPPNHQHHCLPFLLQPRHLHPQFKTNLHLTSLAMYHIPKFHQSHLLCRLLQCRPYHRNPITHHRHSQLRSLISNTKLHQLHSLRQHSRHHPSITKPHHSSLNILNPLLQVLTPQLHFHPQCPSSPKNQHHMAHLLRAMHQMSIHHPLTCHPLADLLRLSTGQTLACMRLLL